MRNIMLVRVLKSWICIFSFESKARLLVKFFQERRHRAGKTTGPYWHDIKTRGKVSQFHQTGQFCETVLPPVPTITTAQREATHLTLRAGCWVITHLKFMNDFDVDSFQLIIKPASDWWRCSRHKVYKEGCSNEASPWSILFFPTAHPVWYYWFLFSLDPALFSKKAWEH